MKNRAISRRRFLNISGVGVAGFAFYSNTLLAQASGRDNKFVIAETQFGKIRGIEKKSVKIFKGIPYGANTTGTNRFMPPVDPAGWTGVRDALNYGHNCSQNNPASPPKPFQADPPNLPLPSIYRALWVPGLTDTGEGEDCLVLNVWTPAINDGRKRPIMLWLHGGSFSSGSGSNTGWDGTNLCLRGDVVVLTINHRLQALGFANFKAFSPDFAASGVVGMLDIIHALQWVKTNIAQFGGDPNNVMIFGQSGGGQKCETLLSMPLAKGLFHRAVIESGISIKGVEPDIATRNAEMLLSKLGIPKAEVHKIQQLPIDQIMTAAHATLRDLHASDETIMGFAPSVDGVFLPQHQFFPVASSVSPDVPVMIGSTRTEHTGLTTDISLWHLDEEGMRAQIGEILGDRANETIELYRRLYPGSTPSDIFFLIKTDHGYTAPTMKIAERRAALGKGPVYLYYFAWETPVQGGMLKSPHNIEWPFAYDNIKINESLTGDSPEAMALADKISDTWIAFARTGNPNNPKIPNWPTYNATDRATMIFNNEIKLVNDPLTEQRLAMFRALKFQ